MKTVTMVDEGGSGSRHRSTSKRSWRPRAPSSSPSEPAKADVVDDVEPVAAERAVGDGRFADAAMPLWVLPTVPVPPDDPGPDREPELPRSIGTVEDRGASVSIQSELSRVVSELRRSIPELNGAMVASADGLSVAHDFPEPEAERMAAMAATALGLGKRISDRTGLGEMQETVVRGDRGYLVVYAAGEQAVLVLSGPFNSNLGLMRIEARAASTEINKLLG